MKHVWMAQCLCGPKRHAILAGAGEAASQEEAEREIVTPLNGTILEMIGSGSLNPWCGICRAPSPLWVIELARTRFATMEEAMPALQKSEVDNLLSRAILGDEPKGEA